MDKDSPETNLILDRGKFQLIAIAKENALSQRDAIRVFRKFQCRTTDYSACTGSRVILDPALSALTEQTEFSDPAARQILLDLGRNRIFGHSGLLIATNQGAAK